MNYPPAATKHQLFLRQTRYQFPAGFDSLLSTMSPRSALLASASHQTTAAMRPPKSCQQCHSRHKRCVRRRGASKCSECEETGTVCRLQPTLQFRFFEGRSTSRRRTRQVNKKRSLDERLTASGVTSPSPIANPQPSLEPPSPDSENATNRGSFGCPIEETSPETTSPSADPTVQQNLVDHDDTPYLPYEDANAADLPISSDSNDLTRKKDHGNFPQSHQNPSISPVSHWEAPELSAREGALLRVFIDRIALSCDCWDNRHHFATVVPKWAFVEPMIFYGIFALASRYDDLRTGNSDDLESTYYHNKCLELLIEALSQPPETYGVSLLVAVVLSRLYEEYNVGQDTQFHHLSGTKNLLTYNTITRSAQQGGLAEAACWVHLHQAIYVSLVHSQKPIEIGLEVFETFCSMRKVGTDCYRVNKSVYLLAQVIQEFFATSESAKGRDARLKELQGDVGDWYNTLPRSFRPVREDPVALEAGHAFPCIRMLFSEHVVALQYHYAAQILFCLHFSKRAAAQRSAFEAARIRGENEKKILDYIHRLVGLARGNEFYPGAFYMPSYMLFICGHLINHPMEREQAIKLLEQMENEAVFRDTSAIVETLLRQWKELDSFGQQ